MITQAAGYGIIQEEQTVSAEKYQYDILIGKDNIPCCKLIFNLSVSEQTLDKMEFSEEQKSAINAILSIDKVFAGATREAGIDFRVESVAIGEISYHSWCETLNSIDDKILVDKASHR